jgi:hypothetical protein
MFTRIIRLILIGWIASMVVGVVAAVRAKGRVGPTTDESADDIVAKAIFGPLDYHSTATSFRGGTVELWYGGGVLDLRDATMAPGGATLRVRAVFGGGQILIPADWRVISNVRGMGGLQDVREAKGYAEDGPVLTIDGLLIAAGVVVMSEVDAFGAGWGQSAAHGNGAELAGSIDDLTNGAADPLVAQETGASPAS